MYQSCRLLEMSRINISALYFFPPNITCNTHASKCSAIGLKSSTGFYSLIAEIPPFLQTWKVINMAARSFRLAWTRWTTDWRKALFCLFSTLLLSSKYNLQYSCLKVFCNRIKKLCWILFTNSWNPFFSTNLKGNSHIRNMATRSIRLASWSNFHGPVDPRHFFSSYRLLHEGIPYI